MMNKPKSYKGSGKYIFISYSHKDNEIVFPIIEELQKKYNVWFDEGIYLGDNYKKTIIEKINNCSLFIYMVSKESLISSFCKKEIKQAERKERPFFNVIIEEDVLNTSEAEEFLFDYEEFQMCQFFNMSASEFVEDLERNAPAVKETIIERKSISVEEEQKIRKEAFKNLDDNNTAYIDEQNNASAIKRSSIIDDVFLDNNIGARVESYSIGRSVTKYRLKLGRNTLPKQIARYVPEIELNLGGNSVVYSEPNEIENKPSLEIGNVLVKEYSFKESLESLPDVNTHPLAIPFGLDSEDKLIWDDIDDCPHILISGTTGSGKSIFLHSLIMSLIYRLPPSYIRFVLIDPKMVEFSCYKNQPHLLTPVINDIKTSLLVLKSLERTMNERYIEFERTDSRDITEYNNLMKKQGKETMPYVLVIIDEYADLVDSNKEIVNPLISLAQKARASGIHLVISTQNATSAIINPILKANCPTRVAFMLSTEMESLTILGESGAEKLLGKGDMLFQSPSISRSGKIRLQGCYISKKDMSTVLSEMKKLYKAEYDESLLFEARKEKQILYNPIDINGDYEQGIKEATLEWAKDQEYISISKIQRELAVGFNRAGRLFTFLIEQGIIESKSTGKNGNKVIKK